MATVRFSEDLVENIRQRAKDTFSAKDKVIHESQPDDFAERFYDWAFSDTLHLMNQLPKGFMESVERVGLRGIRLYTDTKEVSIGNNYNFRTAKFWPAKIMNHSKLMHTGWNSHEGIIIQATLNDPVSMEFYNFFFDRQQKIESLRQQRDKFVDGVMAVCGAYTTLAPALKAWPPLWDLIPEGYRQRHLEVKERKSVPSSSNLSVDLGSLTATVVASKLVR